MAGATADAHLAGIRERLGPNATAFQARVTAGALFFLFWQVQLVDHVERLRDMAAVDPLCAPFDAKVCCSLLVEAPRIVQEAILTDARHSGRVHVGFPGSV